MQRIVSLIADFKSIGIFFFVKFLYTAEYNRGLYRGNNNMKRVFFTAILFCAFAAAAAGQNKIHLLKFDKTKYVEKSTDYNNKKIKYRAYEGIVYVANPVDEKYESMNIYIPSAYFKKQKINGYTAKTAPIFLPNSIGGYMPGEAGTLAAPFGGNTVSASLTALANGLIVAAPGARGRTTKAADGTYNGKAPACIIDLKAAVRYLRYNDSAMPGDAEKIISNGTSAGGALSALLGASGNSKDYEPYLAEIGAADARDDIFASSCYCPVTNLENADAAYEWLFCGHNNYSKMEIKMMTDYHMERKEVTGTLTAAQIKESKELASFFPAYVNSLHLKSSDGEQLSLNTDGTGSFADYVSSFIIASAQKQLDSGKDMSSYKFFTISENKITACDLNAYAAYAVRMKMPGAFDGSDADNAENSLFGDKTTNAKHFTFYAFSHDTAKAPMADTQIVRLMNPMNYAGSKDVSTAKYWRIRHGTKDRDISPAISVILSSLLEENNFSVDFFMPWDVPHAGDYDLDELFSWINSISR